MLFCEELRISCYTSVCLYICTLKKNGKEIEIAEFVRLIFVCISQANPQLLQSLQLLTDLSIIQHFHILQI